MPLVALSQCSKLALISCLVPLLDLSGPVIAIVPLGNGLRALVFGCRGWHRGLEAAMAAHFSFDVILKVILPF
jgi:hypothetical protein